MEFLIGVNLVELLPAAQEAWARFVATAPAILAGFVPQFRVYTREQMETVRAQAVPALGPRYASTEHVWIVLGSAFFKSAPEEQILTLLHEAAHVYFYLGPLRTHTIESIDVWRRERDRRLRSAFDDLQDAKYDLAFKFKTFVDEILAEQLVQRRYPALAADRRAMYLRMREETARSGAIDQTHIPLRCHSCLYELVRNDLGVSISAGSPERAGFERMATDLVARITRECPAAAELLAIRPGLLTIDVDIEPYDFSPFEEMWTRVMATPAAS
jgi:hypothetical protein